MANTWTKDRATKRIDTRLTEVKPVQIKEYVRDTDLTSLPSGTAYRVNGVHLYVEILNLNEMLSTTDEEGVTCHRRTLRFLNLHYRAVRRILEDVDAIEVDFHNQRLHAVITKPYDDEIKRVHRAISIGQLIIQVLEETSEDGDDVIPSARVRVGIDTGIALAVNNGRRGHREPLFLGEPANYAAKRAAGGPAIGIYLTNTARSVIKLDEVDSEDGTALTLAEIEASEEEAKLDITVEDVIDDWNEDLEANPIGRFEFSGHTPPFSDLDLEALSPGNSRRQDLISTYADLDGFTAFVSTHVHDDEGAKDVVRVLHVLRSELDAVLSADFGGRKVRFIGDCIHGVLAEGTAQTTAAEETVSTAILCAGALRSSFSLALEKLQNNGIDVEGLGLSIGFEFGPVALTRLGMKGSMIRCGVGRAVLGSERQQQRCLGAETAIGSVAYDCANEGAQAVFGVKRKRANLDYETALDELARKDDKTAKTSAAFMKAAALLQPTTQPPSSFSFPPRNVTPKKPAGFA